MSPLIRTVRTAVTIAVTAVAMSLGATGGVAAEESSSPPVFEFSGIITDKETLSYNPTGEFVFPSIFHASEHFANPLGEWYLYYAPHESPGGISLMYADSLDGPWTEYAANPLISNQWSPNYSVNHVSSPDAIWNTESQSMYLYFHGGNDQTRVASSDDGITFTYEGTAVSNAMGGADVTETSYARVFPHPDSSSPYKYGMFYMDNTSANHRRIRVAESVDGLTWVVRPDPIVSPGSLDGGNVSAGNLWEWGGQLYVIYHASTGKIFARTIDPTLTTTGPAELLHKASGVGEDVGRTASPEIVTDQTGTYLFYEAGDRLGATIAYATLNQDPALPPDPASVFPTDPQNPVFEQCAAPGSDEFEGTAVDPAAWDRLVRAESARHHVADGVLTIPTYTGGVAAAPLLQQELPDGPWQVTTEVTIDVAVRFQQAGLLLYASDTVYGKFDLGQATSGKTLEVVRYLNGNNRQDTAAPAVPEADTVWLRLTSDGAKIQSSVSYDGASFADYGRPFSLAETPFTHVGPYAFRGFASTPEVEAHFAWFRWSPTVAEYEACLGAVGEAGAELDALGALLTGFVDAGAVSGPLASQLTVAVQQADRHEAAGRTEDALDALGRFAARLAAPKHPDTVTAEATAALEKQVTRVLSALG